MLTFLHIVYSKNRTEAWGCCAAKKKQERYKKCGSHDDQSWHVTVRKVRVWKGYFCNWLRKNLLTLTSSPHWTTTKYWPPPPFLFPLLQFQKKIPPINMSRSWFYLFGVRKLFITTTPVWVIRTKKSASLSSQTCLTRSANTVCHDSESISFLKPKIWNLYQTNSKLLKVCKLSKIKLNIRNLKLLL